MRGDPAPQAYEMCAGRVGGWSGKPVDQFHILGKITGRFRPRYANRTGVGCRLGGT